MAREVAEVGGLVRPPLHPPAVRHRAVQAAWLQARDHAPCDLQPVRVDVEEEPRV